MSSAYSPAQTKAYLDYIGLPESRQTQDEPSLAFLTDLHTHTLSTVPYENLSFHYSEHHKNSLDPQEIFRKIVLDRRGRGGYCMEISILYNHILRSLGFTVYTAGVKIRRREDGRPSGTFVGWVHIVNIVTLPDGTKWMVEIRLVKDHIPAQVDRRLETRMWIYQYRNSSEQAWNSFYAFYEAEFTEADYKVMNWFTGHSPDSPQTWGLLVIKFLRRLQEGSEDSYEVFGKRMLVDGVVKENLGGKTQVVETCTTEDDRIAALRGWFGIELTEVERKGIVGWRTELRFTS
jgi:arylamine N-acetyltransferase